jgi:F420-dependent oxidoreductase-like protein
MKLGLNLGHLRGAGDLAKFEAVEEADRLGYGTVWVAEAYGSDAVSVLGYLAARTTSIELGSAVLQIPARTPAMTAMTATTLDVLSQGRFRLGLGVSGPQVSEGWHGVDFAQPLSRTREYVEVVRMALAREPVSYRGKHHVLPRDGGRPIKLSVRPVSERIPVYLAAIGPGNLRLAGAVADGWLGLFLAPGHVGERLKEIAQGRAEAGTTLVGFDVVASMPVVFGDDVSACADKVRAHTALYVGGMGSREHNFYNALAARMGFATAAAEVQELYLSGRQAEAAAALPLEFLDQTCLLGPLERVAERLQAFAEAGVTTLSMVEVEPGDTVNKVRMLAAAYELAGLA